MTNKDRVRKHREKLRRQQYQRVEVWLSADLIQAIQRIAQNHRQPLGIEVQDALKNHVSLYDSLSQHTPRGSN